MTRIRYTRNRKIINLWSLMGSIQGSSFHLRIWEWSFSRHFLSAGSHVCCNICVTFCKQAQQEGKNIPRTSREKLKLNRILDFVFYLYMKTISCNWYVSYTHHSCVLIQFWTEPLRNKRLITYFLYLIF